MAQMKNLLNDILADTMQSIDDRLRDADAQTLIVAIDPVDKAKGLMLLRREIYNSLIDMMRADMRMAQRKYSQDISISLKN